MKAIRFAALVAALLASPRGHALEWEALRVTIDPDPFEESTQVVYKFKNPRDVPVHITSAFSSCGCTVPLLAKMDYAPGESGELVAVFTLGQVIGDKTRTITVTTDEPADVRTSTLTLEARVPKVLGISPSLVTWRVGERPEAKTITITFDRHDIRPIKVDSRDPRLVAQLGPSGKENGVFTLVLSPTTTAEELYTPVLVTMNLPEKKPRVVMVYAKIVAAGWRIDGAPRKPSDPPLRLE